MLGEGGPRKPFEEVDWIHNFGQVFEPEPFHFRAKLTHNARLSSNHHSLSYSHLESAAAILKDASDGDTIVASSKTARGVIEGLVSASAHTWRGNIEVIPLPVHVRNPSEGERRATRDQLGITNDTVLMLSVGRLSWHDKANLEPLLWAVAELADQKPGVRLVIAGDDSYGYSDELRRLIACYDVREQVRIESDIDDERRDDLYGAADIYVSLYDSHQESFGLAVAEALAAGLPCVCPSFGSIGELIKNGTTGITVRTRFIDPGELIDAWRHELPWQSEHQRFAQLVWIDRRELLAALSALSQNHSLRLKMASQARLSSDRFEPSNVAQQYVEMWTSDLTHRPPRRTQRPFHAGQVFGRFATDTVRGPIRWVDSGRAVKSVVPDDVVEALRLGGVFRRLVEAAQTAEVSITPSRLAASASTSYENALMTVAVLGKYGFLEGS